MKAKLEHYVFQIAILVISVYMLVQAWKDHWWEVPLIIAGALVAFWLIYQYVKWLVMRDYKKEQANED